MNKLLKLSPFILMLCISLMSCGDDDSCTTDPTVTVAENIIGTWTIDGESSETVTFNSNGTGSSSVDAFHFSTTNDDKNYNKFGWAIESDTVVVVTYDYSPDVPVVPFLISEDYTVLLNNCDRIEMESGFGSMLELTKEN